jgi:hypothetical protein
VASLYPRTPAAYTRLVLWLMREKARLVSERTGQPVVVPRGIAYFDEMVVAALGRYGELSADRLSSHVRAALAPADRESYPNIDVSQRVKALGPGVVENGAFRLPDNPIPGVADRHIRALNGLIGALQTLGSARLSALTAEVNKRLPKQYHVNHEYIRAWLTRHPELFAQSEADRFKLATLDVDILCGLGTSWLPAGSGAVADAAHSPTVVRRMRERVAKDIAEFLEREGPQPIGRIRSEFYGRFIGPVSADSAIAANPHRFARDREGRVSLRPRDGSPPLNLHAVSEAIAHRRGLRTED